MRLNTARSIPVALPLEPQAPVAFPRLVLSRSRRIKRSFDIFFAVLFSIAALPVFLLIAVAVLLNPGGRSFSVTIGSAEAAERFVCGSFEPCGRRATRFSPVTSR